MVPGSGPALTHLQGRLQELVDSGDLLAQRDVFFQRDRRRSPRLWEVSADKRIRVVQVLDPAHDGGHIRGTATQNRPPGSQGSTEETSEVGNFEPV